MKKFLTIASAGLICFITGCNNSGEKSASADTTAASNSASSATTTSTGDKNIATIHAINDAISSGEVGKLDQYIATNCVDHSGEHGEVKGLDSIKAELKSMHDTYKDLKLESIQDAANNEYVFSLSRFRGTNTVASMGAPAGTHFDMTSVDVAKFGSDGKVTDHWIYMSMDDAMKMMGGNMHMEGKKKDAGKPK
jgi:SnoaL-like polyketide cyclase